jgi:thiamine pyrophosphate-dependent acetolactate synthase large subunit-like protein
MGEDSAKLVSTLLGLGITYRGSRHENSAVAMAEGYARSTGRLGVVVTSRGPGFTNGLTATVNAAKAGTPVLLIMGDTATSVDPNRTLGPEYKSFAELEIGSMAGIKMFAPTSAVTVRATFRDAIATALRGNAVAVCVPVDLMNAEVDVSEPLTVADVEPARSPVAPEDVGLRTAIEALNRSERPVIVAGRGAWRGGARESLIALAEQTGALLATSLGAKGLFEGHPYNIGIVGTQSHTVGRDLLSQADLVLAFGAALNQLTTVMGTSFGDTQIVQVDAVRAHIGRYSRAEIAVVGDSRLVAEAISEGVGSTSFARPFHTEEVRERIANYDATEWFEPASTRWNLDPRTLVLELERLIPRDRMVALDVGNFFGFVGPHLSVPGPERFHYCYDFSAIGLGIGLAMGVAAGYEDGPTYLFVGDGALLMTLGELETILRCDLPVVTFVLNDAAYGAEKHYLELDGMAGSSATYPDVDFADIAAGYGMEAATVRDLDDLAKVAPLLEAPSGPLLIDCKVNPEVRDPVFAELTGAQQGGK